MQFSSYEELESNADVSDLGVTEARNRMKQNPGNIQSYTPLRAVIPIWFIQVNVQA